MNLIDHIQARIEALYGIRVGEKASNYLITETDLKDLMPVSQQTVFPKELFLVNPNPKNDTLEVALYLNKSLTANLTTHDPRTTLSAANIGDFCALIEGISHFVYYLHKAGLEAPVTELELELQAEIDKFLLLALHVEGDAVAGKQLFDLLFENYSLQQNLSPDQGERYETASGLARKYCFVLSQQIRKRQINKLIHEVRAFYPLTQEEKIRHILT